MVIKFFDAGPGTCLDLLGGKCASLVALTAAGMPVPPGFAVTTAMYDAFVTGTGLDARIAHELSGVDRADVSEVDAVSGRIREMICATPMPAALRRQIVGAHRELQERFDQEVPVAVRSSATAEDLPDASFAGQQDTYLWVVGANQVVEHVRRCWASLYTGRAIVYRLRNQVSGEALSMAVAVQKMVRAKASGVAITMNPIDGDQSKITIDASYGIGEMVVSGKVTPDNIVVDKGTLSLVSHIVGDKHAELVPDTRLGRLVERSVEPDRRARGCLSGAEITAVAALAKRAERYFGCPQDVEWAFDADLPAGEDLVLLQSRPETVHSPRKSFPKPSELRAPAGAEGWEKLYPYNLVFGNPPGAEEDKFWFCDSQHWPTVFKPFETVGAEFALKCLGQYNTRHLLIPRANGIEFKIHLGYLYLSPVPVPADQIATRAPEFERRTAHYFEHWDSLLESWRAKVVATIDEMAALTFRPLPEVVPFRDIVSGEGRDGTQVLLENYDRLIQLCYQNWQYHFEFLNLGYLAYLDFFGFCKDAFPGIADQSIAKMVQGVDMELFRPDDELKKLAALAVELNLPSAFADPGDVEGTLARVRQAGGQRWLDAYAAAQDPWFNFTVGNGFYGHDKYWIEHQEIPLGYIADYIRRIEDGQRITRPVDELVAERDRVVAGHRDRLGAQARASFDAKLRLAATAYPYVENHNFYIEHWTMGVFWRKVRELSRVFVHAGFWAGVDDLLFLNRGEVRDAIFDLVTAWAVGTGATGPHYWPAEIERRRGIIEALASRRPQPALNTPPAQITEPFTVMLWGITTEQVQQWLTGDRDAEHGVLTGMAASPGVAEGIARVVLDADQLAEVREDEILVATITAPSWGPVFGKIKAAVTDIGGMMSHAAIVCREYGLPAVTGTGNGSTTVRTGQRIRVDGDAGRVEILTG